MKRSSRWSIVPVCIAWTVLGAGCGGGGSSAGGNAVPSPPVTSVTILPTTLNVEAVASASSSPTATISIAITNSPTNGVYLGYTFTHSAIANVSLQTTSNTNGAFLVTFIDPAVIGPGVFNDSIRIQFCLDDRCSQIIDGSPRTVDVQYTVTGIQPLKPSLVLGASSVNVEGLIFSAATPTGKLNFAVQNSTSNQNFFVTATNTSKGLLSVNLSSFNGSSGEFSLYFDSPAQLAPGIYDDTVTVTASCNANCPRGMDVTSQSAVVHYEIKNSVSGPQSFTARFVQATAYDLAWSPVQNRLYFASPSTAPSYANSVGVINPVTGMVEASSFAGSEPAVLSVADDGQYLYVGFGGTNSIRRKTLPSLTQDILINLGADANAGLLYAGDIQVAPGHSHTIAVARRINGPNGNTAGAAIFDDATQRTNVVGAFATEPYISYLQWGANSSVLYGNNTENTAFGIYNMTADTNGINLIESIVGVGGAYNFGRIHYADGIIYSDDAHAFDPVSKSTLGTFAVPQFSFSRLTIPDPQHNKFFMIVSANPGIELKSFNLATFAPIASIPMGLLSLPDFRSARLVRWGDDGLAFMSGDGKVVLINGAFVNGPTN